MISSIIALRTNRLVICLVAWIAFFSGITLMLSATTLMPEAACAVCSDETGWLCGPDEICCGNSCIDPATTCCCDDIPTACEDCTSGTCE